MTIFYKPSSNEQVHNTVVQFSYSGFIVSILLNSKKSNVGKPVALLKLNDSSFNIEFDSVEEAINWVNQFKQGKVLRNGRISHQGEVINIQYQFVSEDSIEYEYKGIKYTTHYKSLC